MCDSRSVLQSSPVVPKLTLSSMLRRIGGMGQDAYFDSVDASEISDTTKALFRVDRSLAHGTSKAGKHPRQTGVCRFHFGLDMT